MFGGQDSTGPLNETWVWNGTTWTQLHPATSPPARLWHGMAFDSVHGKVVMFGGTASDAQPFSYLSDTWLWDGTNWTQAYPPVSPSGRQAPAMAFDSVHGQVVLFGGADASGPQGDTWVWDGSFWNAQEVMQPPARRCASMSFDPLHTQVVMFGGDDGTTEKNDTWTWGASGWTQQNPAHSPSARSGQGQAWDSVRNLTVMFGGDQASDTWLWNGSDWTQESTPASPPARFWVNMAYDTQHSNMVLFGGLAGSPSYDLNDTWTLGFSYTENWMLLAGAALGGPTARVNASAAYENANAIMFGGSNGTNTLNETWCWTGDEWSILVAGTNPPARQSAAMTYDSGSGTVLLFGGNSSASGTALLGDLWRNDDGSWIQVAQGTAPPARQGAAMAYDPIHTNMVLFGGSTGSDAGDTWTWNGSQWTHQNPANSPLARSLHSMVFDAAHNQVVLFGGFTNGTFLNDTWVWDGVNWTQMNPANSPPARDNFSMVYDSVHGRVELFGGLSAGGPLTDTWTWDGTNWTHLNEPVAPNNRYGAASAYLPAQGQFFLFGGSNGSSNFADTWIFASPYVSTATLPTGYSGQTYSYTIVPSGGVAPYSFTQDGLPYTFNSLGLALNSSTGAVTGTDQISPGQLPVGIGVTIRDAQGQTTDLVFKLQTDSVITFSPAPLPDATMGANYSVTLTASGGTSPYTFSASGLPAGMSLSGNQIVGQCTASSTNVTLGVMDNIGGAASVGPIALHCNPAPQITTASPLPNAQLNVSYSAQLSTNAVFDPPGAAPFTWSAPSNSLPAGLAVNSSGMIVGTPTAAGTTTFTVTFTDRWNATTSKQFQITVIAAISITTTQLPLGTLNVAYPAGATIAATGGTPAYHFSATGLPAGLGISPTTGAITGTPTQAGLFQPVFTVTDQAAGSAQLSIPITVAAAGTNSEDWVQRFPALAPTGRQGASMFYDSVHSRTILFGGIFAGEPGVLNDTNAWDGTNWTALSPATSPSNRSLAAAAFDVSHGQGVLFGGQDEGGFPQNDTWIWNGTTWTSVAPANSPPARFGAMMAYDGHQIVLFGGNAGGSQGDLNDTWTWNGSNWTQVAGTAPSVRESAAMAFDSAHSRVVLFGGYNYFGSADLGDTWLWNGAGLAWTQVDPALAHPQARHAHAMAYDSLRGQAIVFGGISIPTTTRSDTWAWNGASWTQLNPPHNPTARTSHAMAYDSAHSQVVLFGGYDPAAANNVSDTWLFEGPFVSNLSLPDGTQGAPYSATISVTGGLPPYQFVAPSLPQGITFNTSTGAFGGAPAAAGNDSIPVTIQDANGTSIAPQFTLHVSGTLALSPTTLPDATAGANYTAQLSATGGVLPYVFSVTGLPAGLHLNSGNQIAGQCTASSTNVMLMVTDSELPIPNSASVGPLTVHCNAAPAITTTSPLASGIVNIPYSAQLQMSGGTAPFTWTLTPGTLPAGFSLDPSTGILTGTATTPVTSTFSVTVTDVWGATTTKAFTLKILGVLTITSTSLPNGTAGAAYPSGVSLAVTGGTGSGTYTFSATGLPTGISIDSASGAITGTTTQSGLFTPTFKVTDQSSQTATRQINLSISPGAGIVITSPPLLPSGTSGQAYSHQVQWTGGVTPFNVTGTGLPGWLLLNSSTGKLTGTPPSGGAFSFSITVTDSQTPAPNTGSQTFTLVVNPPAITTQSPLPAATIGIAYAQSLSASAGTSPYAWTSTNLPSWLSLSGTGGLSGTPPVNTPSSVSFDVKVTDSLGAFTSGNFTLPVLATPGLMFVTTSPVPAATVNATYSATIQASGGDGVFAFSLSGQPAWLSINNTTGVLSGLPPGAGPVTFQITVSDNVSQTFSQMFTLPVNATLTFGTPSPLPAATVNAVYSETLTVSGGTPSYTWSATGLPSWLTLSPSGTFSGTPTQAGPVTFQVTVKDTLSHSLSQTYTLPVAAALIINTASPLTAATANFPYMATLTASGGSGSYTWSASGLPSGFNLTPGGVLTGTPQSNGPIAFSVTLKDTLSDSLTQSFTLPVNATVTINTSSPLPAATVQVPYTANFTASGGNPGYTWAATGLPTWLTLTAAGFLTGTPPPGTTALTFPVTVTDSASHSATVPFTLPVNGSLAITTAALPLATANVQYSTPLSATGGSGVYTWSATSLPAGLAISSTGVLSGKIPQAGPYTFQVTVTDSHSSTSSMPFTLLVSTGFPLSFVTQSLAPCEANVGCPSQIVAAGGVPPYLFSLSANASLDGLSFSSNGFISGTPISGAQISIPVVLTDQQQTSIAKTFSQTVLDSPSVTTTGMPPGTVGVKYGVQMAATGGQPPYSWSLYSGSLPPGLTIDQQGGIIQGTPTAAGSYPFSVQARDAVEASLPQQLSIAISAPPIPLLVASALQLPAGTMGTVYSQNLMAAGGSGQYTWTLTGGSLPAGLTLAQNGAITGMPTAAGTATFTAKVTDTVGNSIGASFSLLVTDPSIVALLAANPLPNGAVGVAYNYGINVVGGTPPYFWSITGGAVPPGLTFDNSSGILSGIPAVKGSFAIVLTVIDHSGTSSGAAPGAQAPEPRASVTGNYTIGIAGPGDFQITTAQSLPNGTMGQSYSTTLAASGGAPPYKWQLVSGILPAGLALDAGGHLSGTPAAAGAAVLLIRAMDSAGLTATGNFQLKIVNPNVPAISATPPPPTGIVGTLYQGGFSAAGGHAPYTWSIGTGSLPPGLSLNAASGAISGTPSQRGNFPFTVQVTDSAKVSATQSFAIQVNSVTLQIAPSPTIPNGTANVPYVYGLSASGGTAPYIWSLSAGSLLAGFSIDPLSGVLSGTPVQPGTYPFTISVVDSNFGVASQQYQLTVQSNGIGITTTSLPSITVGSAYGFGLLVANAAPPLAWSVVSGSLPPGIALGSATGLLSGTPTAAGSFTFTVQVKDGTTATTQATFTLVVNALPFAISTAALLPAGAVGTAYSQTLQATGGKGAITWSLASGTLPPGLSLNGATGSISGTPTASGAFSFTVQATDSTGAISRQSFTVNIAGPPPAPVFTVTGLPATSNPGDQPVVTISLSSAYPLPILVTATLSITSNPSGATDLMFSNGSRTIQFTIPANTTQATLAFQTGTLPGTIQLSLTMSAAGVDITPPAPPVVSTKISGTVPQIRSVTVTTITGGLQVTIVGTSTTLDMKTATFHFTPASGATLQTTDVTVDVSSVFTQWYQSAASLATGSQFSLTVPFTVGGNIATIASVSVTLTNSVGASTAVSAIVP